MKELQYFKDPANPKISVALAGINKLEWQSTSFQDSEKDAFELMKKGKFDVLPIVDSNNNIIAYFTTNKWGDFSENNIVRKEKTSIKNLYYLTSIEDAINLFAVSKRKYFFLDNLTDVVGLITIGNLNCKHVYLYLYNLIIQLEHKMGEFIFQNEIYDKDLVLLFEKRLLSSNSKDALKRYKEDDFSGFDYKFIEYLYLTDLAYIFKSYNLTSKLEISKSKFDLMIKRINDIRLVVAHPNKSLIRNDESVVKLNDGIKYMEQLMNLMNKVK